MCQGHISRQGYLSLPLACLGAGRRGSCGGSAPHLSVDVNWGTLDTLSAQDSVDQHQPPPCSQMSHWLAPCGLVAGEK